MPFIGQEPLVGGYHVLDNITTSATNTYNLLLGGVAFSPESANHLLVSLNGVIQKPGGAFSVSGSQITFIPSSGTLSNTDSIDFIVALGNVLDIGIPSDNTVTTAKIPDDAITLAKANDNFYKTGSWTPVFRNHSEGGTAWGGSNVTSDTVGTGKYTKIGNVVTIGFSVFNLNTTGMNSNDTLFIGGIPYKPTPNFYAARSPVWTADVNLGTGTATSSPVFVYLQANTNSGYFQMMVDNANPTTMTVTNFEDDLADITCTMTYHTDET